MKLKGIFPAMLTPLTKDQQVNEDVLRQLTNHFIQSGVHGIFALGTNGEFHLFNNKEKVRIAKVIIEEAAGRVPIMIGTGGNSTEEVIELSKMMEEAGADALSIITPFFIPPTQKELLDHYKAIANESNLPVLLYNIPSKTGINIHAEIVAELADVPNIAGIKDSSGQFENILAFIEATKNKDFAVFAGTDSLILKTLSAGGKGAVAATANMLPETVVAIYNHWHEGNINQAEIEQEKLQPLRDTFAYGTIPSSLKKATDLYGIPVGPPKLPVKEPTGDALEKIKLMVDSYKKNLK
ncbi:4-hydroxy-tetrahydrodipicolinate synthase [Metabacillus arenae]|uniref:4-hydroxy-tetrahydrodipicolinate synthase n=1 Tax=Metabacillus arenae TaxID=2771434 RepID=A0A926RY69_9BACI|nr:4-hydroxy-tetrahydrodipicolinate synthase [Metabacillus arenae]MBD1382638.1 4-hydroxy-tetrahydrodipicolinate synthase [Metabacillus arenae]